VLSHGPWSTPFVRAYLASVLGKAKVAEGAPSVPSNGEAGSGGARVTGRKRSLSVSKDGTSSSSSSSSVSFSVSGVVTPVESDTRTMPFVDASLNANRRRIIEGFSNHRKGREVVFEPPTGFMKGPSGSSSSGGASSSASSSTTSTPAKKKKKTKTQKKGESAAKAAKGDKATKSAKKAKRGD